MGVVMLFLDGVGIGEKDPSVNPIYSGAAPTLLALLGESRPTSQPFIPSLSAVVPLDACLGTEGLPQSGTGQTALFTGVNAAAMLGRHFGPYPHSKLRPVVEEQNLLRRLLESEKSVLFANAFPQRFFDYAESRRSRLTVTTLSALSSGISLLGEQDLREGNAISADITNAGWPELGHADMPLIEPREAGHRLAKLAERNDFVLFEYWKTDHAGHSMDWTEAVDVLGRFDGLLGGVLEEIDPARTLLLLTSDHGNIEDMSMKVHTRNTVPLAIYGEGCRIFSRLIANPEPDLTCVAPAITQFLAGRR